MSRSPAKVQPRPVLRPKSVQSGGSSTPDDWTNVGQTEPQNGPADVLALGRAGHLEEVRERVPPARLPSRAEVCGGTPGCGRAEQWVGLVHGQPRPLAAPDHDPAEERPVSEASARQAARADRLLLDGCVKIVHRSKVSVRARVQSATRRERYYDCGWTMGVGCWCCCPSRSGLCSHLRAVRRVSATPRPARDPLAFVTTLTRLPSRAELHADAAAPKNLRRPETDPRGARPPLSLQPETIGLGPAADGR